MNKNLALAHTQKLTVGGLLAALFMVVAVSFKGFVIIPGITEVRPVNALPVLYGIFFGQVGALASGLGNLLGDALGGTLTPASTAGFIGNYAMAYIPYKVWSACLRKEGESLMPLNNLGDCFKFWFLCFLSSIASAVIIPPAVDFMGIVSFTTLFSIIFLNNFIASASLGLFLFIVLRRVLLQGNIMELRNVTFSLEPVQHQLQSAQLLVISLLVAFCTAIFFSAAYGTAMGQFDVLVTMIILDCVALIAMVV